jgi:alpha-amylase/alpha-mannosidase (GH57 family)
MNTVNFIFAVHNHQPVGNFEAVLEGCFANCYQPFLDILSEFPTVRMALHYSGPLLQFIQRKHPKYIDTLRLLAARNQVEFMGGGFY